LFFDYLILLVIKGIWLLLVFLSKKVGIFAKITDFRAFCGG